MKVTKIYIPLATLLIVGTLFITPESYAADAGGKNDNTFFSGFVKMFAQKFGLDQVKVQAVADEYHTQQRKDMSAGMQKREEERLSKLVADKKITEVQKKAILTKLASVKLAHNPEDMKDSSIDVRKKKMTAMQDELKAWATAQGIDASYVVHNFGMGKRGGMGGRFEGR